MGNAPFPGDSIIESKSGLAVGPPPRLAMLKLPRRAFMSLDPALALDAGEEESAKSRDEQPLSRRGVVALLMAKEEAMEDVSRMRSSFVSLRRLSRRSCLSERL